KTSTYMARARSRACRPRNDREQHHCGLSVSGGWTLLVRFAARCSGSRENFARGRWAGFSRIPLNPPARSALTAVTADRAPSYSVPGGTSAKRPRPLNLAFGTRSALEGATLDAMGTDRGCRLDFCLRGCPAVVAVRVPSAHSPVPHMVVLVAD